MTCPHHGKRCADGSDYARSVVLSAVEETVIVEFRRRTLLPLDNLLGCLLDTILNSATIAATLAGTRRPEPLAAKVIAGTRPPYRPIE